MIPHDSPAGVDRRVLLHAAIVGLMVPSLAGLLTGCGDDNDTMPMMDRGTGPMPGWMMSDGMMDPAMMGDMQSIMDLLGNHRAIRRVVEDVDGGIRSRTTSADTRIAGIIRTHVAAMKARVEQNRPVRHGDPLFAEIFKHHSDIRITVEELPDGIQVTETSADPQVVLLIRAHAKTVTEFVTDGMRRAMQPTALPDGYRAVR